MNHLERYIAFMESVVVHDLSGIDELVTSEVHFVDPFNDVHGIDAYRAVLVDMIANLENLRITVTEAAMVTEHSALLRWSLAGELVARKMQLWEVTGCSAIRFDAAGKVEEHIDYWDAAGQLYESFPVIGPILRYLRRRIGVFSEVT